MEEVGKQGRTIIFVSHNMGVVNQLCEKCILMEKGEIAEYGQTSHVINRYMTANIKNASKIAFDKNTVRNGSANYLFVWAELRNKENQTQTEFSMGDDLVLVLKFHKNKQTSRKLRIGVQCFSPEGLAIANMVDTDSKFDINHFADHNEVVITLQDIRFYPGMYYFGIWLGSENSDTTYDHIENAIAFDVVNGGKLATRDLPRSTGLLFLTPKWESRVVNS